MMSGPRIGWLLLALLVIAIAGCSRGESEGQNSAQLIHPELSLDGDVEVTASIVGGNGSDAALDEAIPEKGTPEWLLREIKSLAKPLPDAGRTTDGDNGAASRSKHQETRPEIAAERRLRNEKTVELATEAIAKTHADPEKEAVFNEAVRLLMEARLQLAMGGEKHRIDELYDDAASLHKRAPKSKAAAEAAFTLARFAHLNAQRHAKEEPRWLEEFARQARLFAENFPNEQSRAVSILYSAGWSCELNRLTDEAIGCYTLLNQKYPESPQAQQVVAVMRRLTLQGQPLELAGPTLDGKYISVDDYRGQVALVVFWATGTPHFLENLPQITAAEQAFKDSGFVVIGVNLDEDQEAVAAFVAEHSLAWPQIFYPDPKERRWNHPVARYYGVRDIPALWLVGRDGKVVDTFVDPANLGKQVGTLLK